MINTTRTIIIGTRGSKLALWQANHVKARLEAIGVPCEIKIIKTQGDIVLHLRLDKLEGKGFFTKELEEELLRGDIDLAVHSHKDLPTQHPAGLVIAAVSERENPAELLIIRKESLDQTQRYALKKDALVGTSSNRRKAQLLAFRPDLSFADLRGNVITRVDKLRQGQYDAILLAKAGITRIEMDLEEFHVVEIPPTELIPAPAQGVLALQTRESDQELIQLLQAIHDKETAEEIEVERRVLQLFEAGCHAPLGAYCRRSEAGFEVWTSKAETSTEFPDRYFIKATSTTGLANLIAHHFNQQVLPPKGVFITRELGADSFLKRAFQKHDLSVVGQSFIEVVGIPGSINKTEVQRANWVFFTSKNSVIHFFEQQPNLREDVRFGIIGRGSEEQLRKYGYAPSFSGADFGIDMDAVGDAFALIAKGQVVLIPRAEDTLGTMKKAIEKHAEVLDVAVYKTSAIPVVPLRNEEIMIFTSPSNVYAYFESHTLSADQRVISIGYATAKALESFGVPYVLPATPDEVGLSEAVFGMFSKEERV